MPNKRKKTIKPKTRHERVVHHVKKAGKAVHGHVKPHAVRAKGWWQRRPLYQKIIGWILIVAAVIIGGMYGIATWYIAKHANEPMQVGVTFIPNYARSFDLDPQETMQAMIDDLGMRRFRLVSYWDNSEAVKGQYNFDELDWQFKKAEESGSKVSLALGLRQPRWPECHMPTWAMNEPREQWYGELNTYIKTVINRYKDSPALESYQLENEFFLEVFGECKDFNRQRLVDEYKLVKQTDPQHKVIVTRSNNALGFPVGDPQPDEFGVSVYKRVWDKTVTRRYFEYPFPAWFYAFLAGGGELLTGKDMIIHELQAEAWLPDGFDIKTAPASELEKSMNPQRLHDRFEYGRATGMHTIDLWGAEWWYYRKAKFNDPGLWDTAKDEVKRLTTSTKQCANPASTEAGVGYSKAPC
jgi:hypothetical protein